MVIDNGAIKYTAIIPHITVMPKLNTAGVFDIASMPNTNIEEIADNKIANTFLWLRPWLW